MLCVDVSEHSVCSIFIGRVKKTKMKQSLPKRRHIKIQKPENNPKERVQQKDICLIEPYLDSFGTRRCFIAIPFQFCFRLSHCEGHSNVVETKILGGVGHQCLVRADYANLLGEIHPYTPREHRCFIVCW
jgi:hypothetical protein